MDPIILFCVGIAIAGMVALGAALVVFPSRCTRALNEWYVIFPAVSPGNRIGLAACRLAGTGLVAGALALGVSTIHLISQLR
jgi:hypothetical protein